MKLQKDNQKFSFCSNITARPDGPALLNSFAKMCSSSSLDCTHHKILLDKEKQKVYVKLSHNWLSYEICSHKMQQITISYIIASSTTAWKLLTSFSKMSVQKYMKGRHLDIKQQMRLSRTLYKKNHIRRNYSICGPSISLIIQTPISLWTFNVLRHTSLPLNTYKLQLE